MSSLQVWISLIGIVLVIIGAYYVTYFIGVRSQGQIRAGNRNISLLDRFAVAKDKGFYVVEIAGNVYIVGVTNQSMTLLDKVDSAAFAESAAECGGAFVRARQGKSAEGRPAAGFSGGMPDGVTKRIILFVWTKLGIFPQALKNAGGTRQENDAGTTPETQKSFSDSLKRSAGRKEPEARGQESE